MLISCDVPVGVADNDVVGSALIDLESKPAFHRAGAFCRHLPKLLGIFWSELVPVAGPKVFGDGCFKAVSVLLRHKGVTAGSALAVTANDATASLCACNASFGAAAFRTRRGDQWNSSWHC